MAGKVIRKDNPNVDEVHVDRPLTNISIAYIQDQDEFVATDIFPSIPVNHRSDKYYKYDKHDWYTDEVEKRADATESAGSGYSVSTDDYSADVWAFHKDIGEQTESNTDDPLAPRADATEFVTHKMLIKRETLFVENFMDTGIWGIEKTGAQDDSEDFYQWDNYEDSEPTRLIPKYKRQVKHLTGRAPNGLVINGETWDELRTHPDIIDLVKYSREAINLPQNLIASALDIDQLLIADAVVADEEEGLVSDSDMESVFGKHGLLFYAPDSPSLRTPSAGYTFTWTGYGAQNNMGFTINQMDVPLKKAIRIEGEMAFDMKVVGEDLGVFLEDIIS